ncbi:GIY-YIG nuclease family protein [Arthrobacter cryoconiti]|uniref:GIY-YIG nuclease family protein n=1 Tax=Arthrobacter cryoconiti TaxID=748907 RepID=A0ABV8QZP2_9MICC|nr:GIY-YIG nuclease family protein [Arthrobacter cryoconiti]MCC9068632.1 GIY-YIG nuclease family protein [Arthrobacter cryoconiti]
MDSPDAAMLEPLIFTRYSMEDSAPVSALFAMAESGDLCGIYVLEFEDGVRYVGQTVNIIRRYADHRRTHGDILAFGFAPCERELLDAYERAAIVHEQRGYSLRNKMLTDQPGGRGDLEIEMAVGARLTLPWERSRRLTVSEEPRQSKDGRFWQLSERRDYRQIRDELARYMHETIPSPSRTGGLLWSLTAFPSTRKYRDHRRLFTLNVGSVEALYVTEQDLKNGSTELEWTVNLWPEELSPKLEALKDRWLRRVTSQVSTNYRSAGPVLTLDCVGTDTFSRVLEQPFILDAAYRLNVTMMRRSTTVFAKHHNHAFAADILRKIHFLDKRAPM